MPHSADSSVIGSDLLSLSTRNSTINDFPTKPVKTTTFNIPHRDTAQDSPAVTGFTFTDLEPLAPILTDLSFDFPQVVKPSAQAMEKDARMTGSEASKRRTQYYEDSFAYKDGHGQSAKERIQKDSPVVAELKTNVIVCYLRREFTCICLHCCRSTMSSLWSPTSPSTCRNATADRKLPSWSMSPTRLV